jgi:hypothetical protein
LLDGFPREDVLEAGLNYFRDVDGLTYSRRWNGGYDGYDLYCIRVTDTETGEIVGYL